MSYLSTINRFSGQGNLGGIISILVARKADIDSIPQPVGGVVYGDVVFKPGKSWVTWNVTSETASTKSDTRTSREGASKNNRLPFSVPKYSAAVHSMFEQATDDELIVLHTDANGIQKIFGLYDAPVKFRYSHNSGQQHADKNGFEGEFYYDGPENMFEYNGEIAAPIPGTAPAIVLYNGAAIASLAPGETLNIISDFGFTAFYITAP